MKSYVETLALPVSLGVVSRCSCFLDTIEIAELLNNFCFETLSLVGMDLFTNAEFEE
jgi:hypothetical protein